MQLFKFKHKLVTEQSSPKYPEAHLHSFGFVQIPLFEQSFKHNGLLHESPDQMELLLHLQRLKPIHCPFPEQ